MCQSSFVACPSLHPIHQRSITKERREQGDFDVKEIVFRPQVSKTRYLVFVHWNGQPRERPLGFLAFVVDISQSLVTGMAG
jgi:hypothetical protein